MLRTVLAVLAGLVVMFLCVSLVEGLGHVLYPPPPGVDLRDPDVVKALIGQLPLMALVFVVIAWALGAFAGAWTAARLSREHRMGAALSIAVAMLIASGWSMWMIPHPGWLIAAGLALPLPLAWIAARLATPTPSRFAEGKRWAGNEHER
jgi:hypothetical protein